MKFVVTKPNLISLVRLATCPMMISAGIMGLHKLFLIVFAVCLLTDFLDGFLARILDERSELGARLDTWGDVTMYICMISGAVFLWPDTIYAERFYIAAPLIMILFSGAITLLKHHRLPAYHTWSAKFASAIIGVCAIIMFTGIAEWPFRFAVVALAISALEETGISLVLPRWHPNVHTIFEALAIRRKEL